MTGRATMVIGTSSVGKSTVARELQELSSDPHLVAGLDHFFSMFPQHWAGHPRCPGPGFWYEDSMDPDGRPRARIRYVEAGQRLLAGMRAAVRALLEAGNDVIVDEMPIDDSIVAAWRAALVGCQSYWVLLTAPLEVTEERERYRPHGRHLGNARGHFQLTTGVKVDLHIDTTRITPRQAADTILPRRPF